MTKKNDKSTAVLMSEEELVDLLKKEAEEEQEADERMLDEDEVKTDKGKVESGEAVESTDDEEAEVEEKMLEEDTKELTEEDVKEESVEDGEILEQDGQVEVEKMSLKEKEQGALLEEADGSTESEIPVDLDYAADSGLLQPLHIVSAQIKPHTDDTQPISNTDVEEKVTNEKGLPTIADDYEQDVQNTEAVDSEEMSDQDNDKDSEAKSKEISEKEPEVTVDPQEPKSNAEFESGSRVAGKEEEKSKNDSGSHTKGKTRKQKKNQRARKHSPQSEEAQSGQEQNQQDPQEPEGSIDNTVSHKAKRRRAGKWVMHTQYVHLLSVNWL